MSQANPNTRRFELSYFEGVNSLVASNIAKKQEFFHAENVRSGTIGTFEKRGGTTLLGNTIVGTANYGLFYFKSTSGSSNHLYRITTVSGVTTIYYLNSSNVWTALTGSGTNITAGMFDGVIAEGRLFLVNSNHANLYVDTDGTTVVSSASASGHLYNSPNANCVAYYKNRLYLADYTLSGVRYKTSVLRSSYPLGIVALVSGDPASPYTTINVTDFKYFSTTSGANVYDIYRGPQFIAQFTVTSIANDSITGTISFQGSFTTVLSADELWISGTYSGAKLFRWSSNPSTIGSPVKEYDTFRLSGGDTSEVKLFDTIGNVLMIGNNNSLAIWNDFVLQSFDMNIGCTSKKGYVKLLGGLYFLHYTGIFVSNGDAPKLISSKVERYISGATSANKEAAVAGKKGRSVFFWIGDVTLYNDDGSTDKTLSDVVLEYNVTQEDWFVHTGIKAIDFETYVDSTSSDRLVYASSNTSYTVSEFLSGETDNGSEIILRADTASFALAGQFEKIFEPQEVIIELERGTGVQVFVSLDKGPFYEIEGTAAKGCTILKITGSDGDRTTPPRCRNIRISLRHALKQLCKVSRVAVTYNPTAEEEPQRGQNDGSL